MTWISREAKDALSAALNEDAEHCPFGSREAMVRARLRSVLDSLPVLDAGEGEAEEALERLAADIAAHPYSPRTIDDPRVVDDLATVRHALRAATLADMGVADEAFVLIAEIDGMEDNISWETTGCESDEDWRGLLNRLRNALRAAQVTRDEMRDRFLAWRGVETPCPKCGGSGRYCYGSTATWRGGVGGQVLTDDVCDKCWGTGDASRMGANLRAAQAQADAGAVEAAHNALDGIVSSFADFGVPEDTAVGCVDIVRRVLPLRTPKEETT